VVDEVGGGVLDDGFIFNCAHGSARSALPLVALALLLRRRRR
jgi:MYXO-CTERM domain-containing protein